MIHPSNTLTAPKWGDIASSVSRSNAIKGGHANPFTATNLPWISYPDGPKNNLGVTRVSFFSETYLWVGSKLMGPITAHSLLAVLGYVLTAFVMFAFIWRVTRSALAGFVAGFAYGFWPHMYLIARADMTYTHMWLYILPIWAFWDLANEGYSRRRVVLAMASVVPAIFWTPYYAFHVLVVGGCGLVVALYYIWRLNGARICAKVGLFVTLSWLIILSIYHYLGFSSQASEVPVRTLTEIYQQSAHPLMYLLPGMFSWGAHGNALLLYLVPRATGANLYVGLSVLVLAAWGVLSFSMKSNTRAGIEHRRQRIAMEIAGLVVVACFLFSLPPTFRLGALSIPTPNLLVAMTVPALRAGQRFVMPLMGGLSILAGLGVWQLLSPLRQAQRVVFVAIILGVLWLDLHVSLPKDSFSVIPSYNSLAALKTLPIAPTAQFHLGSLLGDSLQLPCLIQQQFNKPLINDCGLGRSRDLGQILKLPLCEEITALQAIGTRYLILDPDDSGVMTCLKKHGALERTVADDGTFRVIILSQLDDATRANLKIHYNLP